MPKFLYWSAPSVLLLFLSVILNLSDSVIIFTFLIAYLGLFVEFVRSIIIAKETPVNKIYKGSDNYYKK